MRSNIEINFVLAGMKQETDLFTIKGAPFVVMTGHLAIDARNK